MKAFITQFDRLVGGVIDGAGLLSGLVIAFMAISISTEVVVRAFGGSPFGWTLELCEYGLLIVAFLGAPWVLRHGDHIRVDVVLRSVSGRWRNALLILANGIAAVTCLMLTIYGTQAAAEAYVRGSMLFKQIVIPQWPVLSIMPLGMALLGFEFLSRCLRRLAGRDIPQEALGGTAL